MKAYVGPYFEFEVQSENLNGTPYPSPKVSERLLAVVRLRPKLVETGKEIVHIHVIAFVPRRWSVGISSISEDNVFHIEPGSILGAQSDFYHEYKEELEELENFLNTETTVRFGFVCLD